MKITLKINIGNYESIDFETSEHNDLATCYLEIKDFLLGWLEFGGKRQYDNVLKLLGEKIVESLKEEDGLRVVEEVKPTIRNASPGFGFEETKEMDIKIVYLGLSESGKAYSFQWIGHKNPIWLPKKLVDSMNKDFSIDIENVQTIRVPTKIMEDKG